MGVAIVTILGSFACIIGAVGFGRKGGIIAYCVYLGILALLVAFTNVFAK